MAKFIMMVGIPGSGKSTIAEDIASYLGGVVVSSDAIRKELLGDERDQSNARMVFDLLDQRVRHNLEHGRDVVYDATNINHFRRMNYLRNLGIPCNPICVFANVPIRECKARNMKRDRNVPDNVIDSMGARLVPPTYDEGWKKIITITSYDKEWLKEVLMSEN